MDTCAVETGLLSKKPCGQPAATRCANCEMALCSKHAIPRLVDGKKTGKFLCKECDAAKKAIDHTDALAKKKAATAALMGGGPPPKPAAPAAPAAKPTAPAAAAKPEAKAPASEVPKPQAPKPGEPEKKGYDGGIDFEPTKK